jgi:molybdenum cofactor cytidylyltransferase
MTILGAHREAICAAVPLLTSDRTRTVINDDWNLGIASSIQAGLRALAEVAPQVSGVLILACDQPRLTKAHLQSLLEAFEAQALPNMVASAYAGTLGIPAVFPREVFPELHALRGDMGARALLMQPPCPLLTLPFPGGEIDIDLPPDIAHLE